MSEGTAVAPAQLPSPHARTDVDVRSRLVTPGMIVLWLVLASVPLWIARVGLYPYLGVEILIWALYALAFNLVLGTAGLPSFGHGAYFGVGAYAFGLCQFNVAANLWLCLAAAALAAGLAGALVALFISHRRGIYYAFMTIAFGQIFWTIAIKSHGITGGEDGLLKIARLPADFGVVAFDLTDNVALYYFVLAVFALAIVALWRLVHSPYGRVLAAIRQSEIRAEHLGYRVWLYKASVFTISAAVSGLAGGLFAMAQLAAFPDVMSLHQSGYVVMMTLVGGGLVSFWGPVVGVVVFLVARDVIGALTNAWMLYFGLLFMIIVLFRPEGIAGAAKALLEGRRVLRGQGRATLRLLFRS
jgi:branched-chain amino acid transport system permease protein